MTDFDLLAKTIDAYGMPMTVLAERSGISRYTLYNRFKGVGEFTAEEISSLCLVLHINKTNREKIFFAKQVEPNSTKETK